jgi:hypothetical protein
VDRIDFRDLMSLGAAVSPAIEQSGYRSIVAALPPPYCERH